MGENSDNIALYAAVKTLHTEGHDMWSAVASLTLLVIAEPSTVEQTGEAFKEEYDLEVPQDVLKTILSRLKKNGLINYDKQAVSLTEKGAIEKTSLNSSVQTIRREYTALANDFKSYLKKSGINNQTSVNTAILDFIDDNIGFASELVTSKKTNTSSVPASAVADYIIHIEKSEPKLFELLQNIFFGRLYISLIKTRTELDANANFSNLNVYLDTNVLLSLLGLKEEVICKSAEELLKILKTYEGSINVCAFDATIRETLNVLKGYSKSRHGYVENIKVDSIYYKMKLRNIDDQDLSLLIENLTQKVESLGITIVKEPEIGQEKLISTESELSYISANIEQEKSPFALQHDAQVIESIKYLRGLNRTRLLEKSKEIFVSQDKSVYLYARELSKDDLAFPLAIRPVDIISLLWIKALGMNNDAGNGNLLRHAVMGYARERLINNHLWDNFVQKLGEAQKKGDITKEDVGLILASDETEKLLMTNNTKVVSKIIDQQYIAKLKKDRQKIEQNNAKSTKKLGVMSQSLSKYQAELEEAKATREKEEKRAKNAEIKLNKLEKRINNWAKSAALVSSIILWTIAISIVVIIIFVRKLNLKLDVNNIASWIAVIALVSVIFIPLLTNRTYKIGDVIISVRHKIYITFFNWFRMVLTKFLLG